MKFLTSKVLKLEKLQNDRLQSEIKLGTQQWNRVFQNQQNNKENKFKFSDFILWFPKGVSHNQESSLENGLDYTRYSMCCLTMQSYW